VRPILDAWHRDSPSPIAPDLGIQALDLAGLELTNEDIASLALPDDFRHVEELELSGNPQLSWLHPEFLDASHCWSACTCGTTDSPPCRSWPCHCG
jgi:hypothetical protein